MEKLPKLRKYRSASKHQKPSPIPLPRKSKSPKIKQTDSIKLTKEEIKYQRFINDLKKEIKVYLDQRLRETQFDPSISNPHNYHRIRSKSKEFNLLTAHAQTILTGPTMKNFYMEFIQPPRYCSNRRIHPVEESIIWPNEQE